MPLDTHLLQTWMSQYLLPFFRLMAVFSVAPIFGSTLMPVPIRLAMGLALTIMLVPLIPAATTAQALPDFLSAQGIALIAVQIGLGLAMGFALKLVFATMEIAGQAISMQMGLGFAELVDPGSGSRMPALSHLYTIATTLLFLSMDGHLQLLRLINESLQFMPPNSARLDPGSARTLVDWGGEMFRNGVLLALPVMASMMTVNLAMGVMTRAVPQFNLFIAFPLLILAGLVMLAVTLPQINERLALMLTQVWAMIQGFSRP